MEIGIRNLAKLKMAGPERFLALILDEFDHVHDCINVDHHNRQEKCDRSNKVDRHRQPQQLTETVPVGILSCLLPFTLARYSS